MERSETRILGILVHFRHFRHLLNYVMPSKLYADYYLWFPEKLRFFYVTLRTGCGAGFFSGLFHLLMAFCAQLVHHVLLF